MFSFKNTRQHKFKMAIELGAKLIELLETAYGSSHPEVATAYTNYVRILTYILIHYFNLI